MKHFENLVIPDGITFFDKADETNVGDERTDCSSITNGGIEIDYWKGVTEINKNCRNISCCNCIFHNLNYEKRLKYFKELKLK